MAVRLDPFRDIVNVGWGNNLLLFIWEEVFSHSVEVSATRDALATYDRLFGWDFSVAARNPWVGFLPSKQILGGTLRHMIEADYKSDNPRDADYRLLGLWRDTALMRWPWHTDFKMPREPLDEFANPDGQVPLTDIKDAFNYQKFVNGVNTVKFSGQTWLDHIAVVEDVQVYVLSEEFDNATITSYSDTFKTFSIIGVNLGTMPPPAEEFGERTGYRFEVNLWPRNFIEENGNAWNFQQHGRTGNKEVLHVGLVGAGVKNGITSYAFKELKSFQIPAEEFVGSMGPAPEPWSQAIIPVNYKTWMPEGNKVTIGEMTRIP